MQTDLAFKTGWDFEEIRSWHHDKLMHFWGYMELKNEEEAAALENKPGTSNGRGGPLPDGVPISSPGTKGMRSLVGMG